MCFILITHNSNCDNRRISTLKVRQPEFAYDIYHPFEDPPTCQHHVGIDNPDGCRSHGTCCRLTRRLVCPFWVGFAGGFIKCRGFDREFHIVVPRGGVNNEVEIQFRGPFEGVPRLTREQEERLYEAQVRYFDEGVKVRMILEDSLSPWIENVNPPDEWRPLVDRPPYRRLLARFDEARERWETTCPMLRVEGGPPQHDHLKATQSEVPYWYKVIRVLRSGKVGTLVPAPDGAIDDENAPAQETADGTIETAPAEENAPVPEPPGAFPVWEAYGQTLAGGVPYVPAALPAGGNRHALEDSPDYGQIESLYPASPVESVGRVPSSEGPTRIFSSSPGEYVPAPDENDEQELLAAPVPSYGYGALEPPAEEPWGELDDAPEFAYGSAGMSRHAQANPNSQWSPQQLSTLRDMLVQEPAGNPGGVRVHNGMVGIPVTGMVWLPAEGLLNTPINVSFHLDNIDDRGYNREDDALLPLSAERLGRLLNAVPRDIPRLNHPQALIPEADVPIPSIEGEDGFAPRDSLRLPNAEVLGGSGEGPRPFEPGESQRSDDGGSTTNPNTSEESIGTQVNNETLPPTRSASGDGGSATNPNTPRESNGTQENNEALPPTRPPSDGSARGSFQQAAPAPAFSSPLPDPRNEADGSRQSVSPLPATPPSQQQQGNPGEGSSRRTRKRAAEADEVEEAPPQPTRRQPAKRRRVEQSAEQPIEQPAEQPAEQPIEQPIEEPVIRPRRLRQLQRKNYKV
ncbi:unnamed protein product [Clonostachys rosea]|uniref:Uncharacterized protein n=1 Tax=Bionectria ochroleuca TaxID=29856 RepID=A0ABY6UZJ4_BIOOC|nr:unnamed protein product [Clonostachys rosea]